MSRARLRYGSDARVHGPGRAGFFYYTFHGYAFSQPILAVALWIGLVMLGLFREERAPEPKEKGKSKKEKVNSKR
jgi:hypothetical protein